MRAIDLSKVTWRKSSYSNQDGGECIEVSDDLLAAATWRRSSYSSPDGGECLEVVDNLPTPTPLVPVRDSKNPHGPALVLPAAAWASFVTAVRRDELPGA
ncbi:DUF397 domain-containing protein [Streptomyces mirabilis]|uniref:DUF397 domain-containing protein n=1 Tax=Streptomyces mirabilis TaxID=68239 RepID=UPI0033C11A65